MKTEERERARFLRRNEGRSVKEIAGMLGVARSSASLWVRDIELTDAQRATLRARNPAYNGQCAGAAANAALARERRLQYQADGRRMARPGDPRYTAGCMLYWAEGAKSRNILGFSNADPDMMRFFADFLRTYFAVSDDALRLRCYLYADHEARQREVERYWLSLLDLPRSSLQRSAVNRYSRASKRKRINMLPYGTARICVYSTRVAQTVFGSIQELAGFDRQEWTDMP